MSSTMPAADTETVATPVTERLQPLVAAHPLLADAVKRFIETYEPEGMSVYQRPAQDAMLQALKQYVSYTEAFSIMRQMCSQHGAVKTMAESLSYSVPSAVEEPVAPRPVVKQPATVSDAGDIPPALAALIGESEESIRYGVNKQVDKLRRKPTRSEFKVAQSTIFGLLTGKMEPSELRDLVGRVCNELVGETVVVLPEAKPFVATVTKASAPEPYHPFNDWQRREPIRGGATSIASPIPKGLKPYVEANAELGKVMQGFIKEFPTTKEKSALQERAISAMKAVGIDEGTAIGFWAQIIDSLLQANKGGRGSMGRSA